MIKRIYILFAFTTFLFAQTGKITGMIVDNSTHQPLSDVNVIVENTLLGSASNVDGYFYIDNIPNGIYNIKFSAIGYRSLVKLNIQVSSNRPATINVGLVQQIVELEGVTVSREYFEKDKDAVVSSRTIDLNEIRRDPAGSYDIQVMMQSLPAVVSGSDQQNEIITRGGAPGENLFIMDNIEIANPNHFGEIGSGGGPINMINTLFIDRVDFMAGAFPAKYGNKASSVMDISLREGNRLVHSQDIDMSMAGIGINVEGPIANGDGSYMASFKKSYLDLIISNTGLTAVPRYWSTQSKLVYDISPTDKIMFNFVYGNDAINLEGENSAWSRGAENVDVKGYQYAYGITYKKLISNRGLLNLTLANTSAYRQYDVYRLYDKEKKYYANQDFTEYDLQAKVDLLWKLNKRTELSCGIDWTQLGSKIDSWVSPDTVFVYSYNFPGSNNEFVIIDESLWTNNIFPIINNAVEDSIYYNNGIWNYSRKNQDGTWDSVKFKKEKINSIYEEYANVKDISTPRIGSFLQLKYNITNRIKLNIGLRTGYLKYTNYNWVAPRFGLTYALSNKSNLSFAYGRHSQVPNLTLLAMDDANKSIKNKYNDQYVAGIEHYFTNDTRGTIEAYWKEYKDIPVFLYEITTDPTDEGFELINMAHAKSYGVEFFLQKKMAKNIFGTISYSWYRAFNQDVRISNEIVYYPQTYDYQNVVSIVGGYRIPLKGHNIKPISDRDIFTRFIGKILGLGSDEVEISAKYRFVGGKPFTPQVYNYNVQRWYDDPTADYNTERLDNYHRLDIMILWHAQFKKFNMVSYIDLQNVFNRDNIWDIQMNSDGTQENIYQYKVFPVGGFTIEF